MEPPDTSDLSARLPNVLSVGVPVFTMPFLRAWSDVAATPQRMQTARSSLPANVQINAGAASVQANAAVPPITAAVSM
ncbi:unnamed protein product [Phytophthora fragariaefolia]|uniref:Unnamed protein product n=1 Tax=Phytophthora fragariaefolia TaxID=1490495 RepID=A0A9W6XRD4_9STRA|nr:unnamed protein product [Phytophthora fragariaefolia]